MSTAVREEKRPPLDSGEERYLSETHDCTDQKMSGSANANDDASHCDCALSLKAPSLADKDHLLVAEIPDDIWLRHILPFVGRGSYRFVAGVNRRLKTLYCAHLDDLRSTLPLRVRERIQRTTTYNRACESVSCLQMFMQEENKQKTNMIAMNGSICKYAASSGRLEVLKWARDNGCEWDADTCSSAAWNGHLDVLKWAHDNGCEWNTLTCSLAARGGHLDVLKWARDNGCKWDMWTCSSWAARGGHLDVLKWARDNGCDWDADTCSSAAFGGHLDVLKWARDNGCEWDAKTCSLAAWNGHLDVLQWARDNGCEWDAKTCSLAAWNGHLDVLQWARDNGCPE